MNEISHENIDAQLEAAEQMVDNRLKELSEKFGHNYWPENMGMILAAEGMESRFSLGNSIVKAVWNAELTSEQLDTITSKLENEKRLIKAGADDLKEDMLVIGRFLSRIRIDFKEIFAEAPELRLALLTRILKSMEVILAEYEKEKAGEVRSMRVRDFLEGGLVNSIRNMKWLENAEPNLDKNIVQTAASRYQTLLEAVQKIDPNLILDRQAILKLDAGLDSILSISYGDEFELEIASDEVFANVLQSFQELVGKTA